MTLRAHSPSSICLSLTALLGLPACDAPELDQDSPEELTVPERLERVIAEHATDDEPFPTADELQFTADADPSQSAAACEAVYCEDPTLTNSCADPTAILPGFCIVMPSMLPECVAHTYYASVCPDMTPAEASTLSWDLKTNTSGNSLSADARLHLSDPAEPFLHINGQDHYLGYYQAYRLPSEDDDSGGSWLVRDGQMVMVHSLYTGSWPPFVFTVGQYGRFDDATRSVTEGARIGLLPGYVDEGLWSMSQLGDVERPSTSGQVLPIAGCWEVTTDWDNGILVTADLLFDDTTNGFQSQAFAFEHGHFAAVENALGEQQLVMTFMNNGATLGGMLSTDCPGGEAACINDGIGIIPMETLGAPQDYLDGASDNRSGSWTAVYKGPSCSG